MRLLLFTLSACLGFLPAIIPPVARVFGGTAARRAATSFGISGIGGAFGTRFMGGDSSSRRRRRRRALTASDRADIAFIQATISKAAADRFAQQIVASRV